MLAHPTLDQLNALGLYGLAKGFKELENKAEVRGLDHAEWLTEPSARQGGGQRRATLQRNGKRAPPVVAHRHPGRPSRTETSSHFAEAQIHARLTNPAKQNIITSIRGSRRPVADFKSEARPASNRNQWPPSYWNAWPASSVSALIRLWREKRGEGEP